MTAFVRIDREEDVAVLTLDRPERRNALGSRDARAVAAAVDEGAHGARVLILTGAGDAFSAGGDLDELERWGDLEPAEIGSTLYESFQAMIRAIRRSDAVVIAAVNGAAVGAGMDLALACDLRVAADTARLGQVWVRLGVIPGTGGAWLTQHLAGPGRAAQLLLTGELIGAEEALAAGLVNEVCPRGELMDRTRALAARILAHPPAGVVANKRALVAATGDGLEEALAHAAEVQPGRFTSDEFRRAVRSARSR
ncbi:MAG TPA: enoyl-CoA hydratase/isomerase family protein [Actinomycetota bacterium]|nr:enoyl-CoA hydratase/isomerase family protein [Actinomycetota bacterium]